MSLEVYMLKGLMKVANKLDSIGLTKEADTIDALIRKIVASENNLLINSSEEEKESDLKQSAKE